MQEGNEFQIITGPSCAQWFGVKFHALGPKGSSALVAWSRLRYSECGQGQSPVDSTFHFGHGRSDRKFFTDFPLLKLVP